MKKHNLAVCAFVVLIFTMASILMQNQIVMVKYFRQRIEMPIDHESLVPDKWIVISSLRHNDVTAITGWVILVYGEGSHKSCRFPSCITLDDGRSHLGENRTITSTVSDRRQRAYLLAISKGAAFICVVTHLRPELAKQLALFTFSSSRSSLVPTIQESFVQPSFFFARENNHVDGSYFQYTIYENTSTPVQMLAPVAVPSVYYSDIIEQLPPVTLPVGTFTSLESDATLFRYDAFWALGLLGDLDSWSNLVLQRLLWLSDRSVRLIPSSANRTQNPLNHKEVIIKKSATDWKCTKTLLQDCIMSYVDFCLTVEKAGFLKRFMNELLKIGYTFPLKDARSISPEIHDKELTVGIMHVPTFKFPERTLAHIALTEECPREKMDFSIKPLTDIALIIGFNEVGFYKNIPLLEAMYKPYFKHVIFCGPNITDFIHSYVNTGIGYYIYIEAFKRGWMYMYECTAEAMKIGLKVRGFLQIGDDTILNPWNLMHFPRDSFWLHTGLKMVPFSKSDMDWAWWENGKPKVIQLIEKIKKLASSGNATFSKYLDIYRNNSKNFDMLFISGCDFMYAPMTFAEEFITLSEMFTENHIMVEFGYPSIVMGLQLLADVHVVKDGSLWRRNRQSWVSKYSEDLVFMHPFKLGKFLKRREGKRILCEMFMRHQRRIE